MLAFLVATSTLLFVPAWTEPCRTAPVRRAAVAMDLLQEAGDGNIAAALEMAAIVITAAAGSSAAWSLVRREELEEAPIAAPPVPTDKVAVDVDLGPNGEPPGVSRLLFTPLLPRSEMLLVERRVPLGMLIEQRDADSTIVVTGALPGFSTAGVVEEGDIVRAVSAYAMVAGDAPMWQQVTSGTPIGDVTLRRLVFRTDERTRFADVRDAIASHRQGEACNETVTLVLERAVDEGTPLRSQPGRAKLEPLQGVLARDLSTLAGAAAGEASSADGMATPPSPTERARRLLEWRRTTGLRGAT